MSFKTKIDYCGLATEGQLEIFSTTQNKSSSTVTAQDKNGDIIQDAVEVFGENEAPSCEYKIVGNLNLSNVKLGSINNGKFALGEVSFSTTAGGESSFSAKCEQVEDNATSECTYDIPTIALKKTHHAQIVWGCVDDAFGDGCHLQSSSYTATCTITKTDVEGVHKTHGVSAGELNATLTIKAVAGTIPTITKGEGWEITSPLTETNPDSEYPTYTVTLTKYLTGTHA